jgi:hypothetical protein
MKGYALHYAGNQGEARRSLERVLKLYVSPKQHRRTIWFLDLRILVKAMLARVLCVQGFIAQAIDLANQSLQDAVTNDHKHTICETLRVANYPIALMAGDLTAAERWVAMLIDLATSLNTPFWQAGAQCARGVLLIRREEFAAGSALLREVLERWEAVGWAIWHPEFLGVLAEGLAGLEQHTKALAMIDTALMSADRGGENWYAAELHRNKGELLLKRDGKQFSGQAEECICRAIELARQQGALLWELRAALSLARLRLRQDRRWDAQQVLTPVCRKFTEGFETPDLRESRAILANQGRF